MIATGAHNAITDVAGITVGNAAETASARFLLGNAGAGYGATAGPLKGGLGSASLHYLGAPGFKVGALAAVNAFGSAVMPGSPLFWAWPYERNGELGRQARFLARGADFTAPLELDYPLDTMPGANTTLCAVATDAPLSKSQARRVGMLAADCVARAVARGVYEAQTLGDFPAYRDVYANDLITADNHEESL